jgi:hypothetical protein
MFSDIELFLIGWFKPRLLLRPEAFCHGWEFDNKEPEPTDQFPAQLIVIRDDGMTRTSSITAEQSVGVSVIGGTKRTPFDTKSAARMMLALAEDLPSADPTNPVTALLNTTGPFGVTEGQDRARQYLTLTLAVAGVAL